MTKFISNISQFIETQFPAHMREQGQEITTANRAVLIDFVEAYYEWLEENYSDSTMLNREMLVMDDVDTTLDEYLKYFREKYLKDFPYVAATDDRFLIKNIIDLYRTKGTTRSVQLLIRLLFNKNADVYLPGQDIFRASHSKWYVPKYLEVLHEDGTYDLTGKQVIGSSSAAKAFVEGVVTKRINGVYIDVIYISDIQGEFMTGDRVVSVDSGNINVSPLVVGSLSSIVTDDSSISGFSVGDIFNVVSNRGKQGKAKVTEVYSFGRSIEIDIEDKGYGYTTDTLTDVYASDLIVEANTIPGNFENLALLTQKVECAIVGNNAFGELDTTANGEFFTAYDSSNNATANGVLVEVDPYTETNSNTSLFLQLDSGTILPSYDIVLSEDEIFIVGENVEEGDEVTISVDTSNGSFSAGDILYQQDRVAQTTTYYATGEVVSANASMVVLKNVYGTFDTAKTIFSYHDTDARLTFSESTIDYEGGTGVVSTVTSNTEVKVTSSTTGKFLSNNSIRGVSSGANTLITSIADTTAETITIGADSYDITAGPNVLWKGYIVEYSKNKMKLNKQN